jgi:hypothetical protein
VLDGARQVGAEGREAAQGAPQTRVHLGSATFVPSFM